MLTKAKSITALSVGLLAITAAACTAIAYQTGEILKTQRSVLAELRTSSARAEPAEQRVASKR
jgi:hypothetical protein